MEINKQNERILFYFKIFIRESVHMLELREEQREMDRPTLR